MAEIAPLDWWLLYNLSSELEEAQQHLKSLRSRANDSDIGWDQQCELTAMADEARQYISAMAMALLKALQEVGPLGAVVEVRVRTPRETKE